MFSNKLISNKSLITRIIIFIVAISIVSIFISSFYVKKIALDNLGEDDAKKTSELIFEIMNAKMQEGWAKQDLIGILSRLELIRDGLKVNSYRSKKVEEVFGVYEKDTLIVQNDKLIQKALSGKKQFLIQEDGSIRYLYPMTVKQECIKCHHNTKVGDINGVLEIKYPPNEIKISLDLLIKYFFLFFVFFIIASFIVLYYVVNRKIINPIQKFSNNINDISNDFSFTKKSNINSNIKEIYLLENNFNLLLEKIGFYYKELLNNLFTDNLTSLPNTQKLNEDLKKTEYNSLLIIDIDSFKQINGFYGLKIGDDILKQTANHLTKLAKDKFKVYRLYSDEFALLANENTKITQNQCLELISKLNKQKYFYKNTPIIVSASMGAAFNTKARSIQKASIALRSAKNQKTTLEVFEDSLDIQDEYKNHITWSNNIKNALDENKLIAFFQPIKNCKTNEILKYESLARIIINNQAHAPGLFMNIAKKAKLYPNITKSIIDYSFKYFNDKNNLEFSINYSVEDIANKETTKYLIKQLKEYKIGNRLIIELLESEEIDDFELINNFINEIKTYGVKIAIDDFGSGYSNFSYILNLNVDFLKIDGSLIKNLHNDQNSKIVVETIIEFAKKVNLKTIAEMVHNEQIQNLLIDLGVDYVQGYYIGKPKDEILN